MRLTTLSIILAALSITPTASAHARPLLEVREQLDESTKLTLARAMVGEADWHEPDHVAIAFVLAKRWPLYRVRHPEASFQQYIALYSSAVRRDFGARSTWLRSLPWGPIEGPHSQRWDRVRALVDRFSEGRLRDPCPGAMHWGGAMDRPAAGMTPVSCGFTRNIFYGLRAPSSSTPNKLSSRTTRKSRPLIAVNTTVEAGGPAREQNNKVTLARNELSPERED